MGWKLIYSDGKVHNLFNTTDKLYTRKTIYECSSQEECFNKIDELQLYYHYNSGDTINVIFSGGTRIIIPQ